MIQWKLGKMKGIYRMLILLTILALGLAATKVVHWLAILLVDIIATTFAALLHLQSHKIARRLLAMRPAGGTVDFEAAWTSDRAQRRLMARHLRNALRLTEVSSLFPASSSRGLAVAQAWIQRAA